MSTAASDTDAHARRVPVIREEMKFELGILHDRINALVSAEAFLIISFTMSLAYSNGDWSGRFFLVAPLLALVGFLLAMLARPGVRRGVEIVEEWNELLIDASSEARKDPHFVWRRSIDGSDAERMQDHHRKGMSFARYAPMVFAFAWILLAALVLTGPMRHP